MVAWTEEEKKRDVAHDGRDYIRLPERDAEEIRGGVAYRTGPYSQQHAVHIIYADSEHANRAGQVLRERGLYGDNIADMDRLEANDRIYTQIRLRVVFGASTFIAKQGVPVCDNKDEAMRHIDMLGFSGPSTPR